MENSKPFTVFTPTYNRAHTLSRVYNSLLNQTDKDFIWLIIDDGSTDNTKELVQRWVDEKKIIIEYYYKPNGGKHTAMKMGWEKANTKYLLAIDSDDELTPDAVDVFNQVWKNIEREGAEDSFAEVSGLTHSTDGKLIGDYFFPPNKVYVDSFWHEMVLKNKNNNEHIVCWNLAKLRDCVVIPDKFWLSDNVNYFYDSVFWARIGRNYKTRYLNKGLRIYHFDAGESIMRISDIRKVLFNTLVSNKFFLDENLDHFFWNPKYFFNLILKFIVSSIELRISPIEIMKEVKSFRFKLAYLLCWSIGLAGWIYFKFIKKTFWF